MPIRRAFARPGLLLAVMSAVGAATLLLTPDPAHAPQPVRMVRAEVPHGASSSAGAGADGQYVALPHGCFVYLPDLPGQEVEGADLRAVHWRGVNLRKATFTACDFRGADLRGADLHGALISKCDLREARLEGANLRGVRYDRFTCWPAGFRPEAHGARLEE